MSSDEPSVGIEIPAHKTEHLVFEQIDQDAVEDVEGSIPSDLECPVCHQLYIEPVLAGCGRHTFCKNCLMKSQHCQLKSRCPLCRAASDINIEQALIVIEVEQKVKEIDLYYEKRVALAKKEREQYFEKKMARIRALVQARQRFVLIVQGAGAETANGTYVEEILPGYCGPRMYRLQRSNFYLYRWRQRHWVIAELEDTFSMGDESLWFYTAPIPFWREAADFPPTHGWQVGSDSFWAQCRARPLRACHPAPEVRWLTSWLSSRAQAHSLSRAQERSSVPSSIPVGTRGIGSRTNSNPVEETTADEVPVSVHLAGCHYHPSCEIM